MNLQKRLLMACTRCFFMVLFFSGFLAQPLLSDCTRTNLGITPLPDRAYEKYKGLPGGLYPGYANTPPPHHRDAGFDVANTIEPLDPSGSPDEDGSIVMTSIGMSNTTQEFSSKGRGPFKTRADTDPAKNPRLIIVDGAQGGRPATDWTNVASTTWTTVHNRLNAAGVTSNQVQVLWMKQARAQAPNNFPTHALLLQQDLEQIMRNAKLHFPNLKIAYVSSRTRSYSLGSPESALNPEPQAFESGFSVKWMIEKQITNSPTLNFDPAKGPVVSPFLKWGPYLWADGTAGRSDGFLWRCNDLESDLTHPNTNGAAQVGAQLLAFFKTDPTATPWFLKQTVVGQAPTCQLLANVTSGIAPLQVNFSVVASDQDGTIRDTQWNFDDGTFATNAAATKIFKSPGLFTVRVTVTDNAGNTAQSSMEVEVNAVRFATPSVSAGRFVVPVMGMPNLDVVVWRSEDMRNWTPVTTNRVPFTFSNDVSRSRDFYRATALP